MGLGFAADLLSQSPRQEQDSPCSRTLSTGRLQSALSVPHSPASSHQSPAFCPSVLLLVDPFYTRSEGSRCLGEHLYPPVLLSDFTVLSFAMYATKALCMRVCAGCFSALCPAFRLQLTAAVYSGKASQETRSGYPRSVTRASTASPQVTFILHGIRLFPFDPHPRWICVPYYHTRIKEPCIPLS